jgi:hypothetical protein
MTKKWLAVVALILVIVSFLLWSNAVWRAQMFFLTRQFAYRAQAWFAAPVKSPEEAYRGFRRALKSDGQEFMRYLSPQAQEIYEPIFAKPEKRQLVLSWPEEMTKNYQMECELFEACVETAVYNLQYYQPDWETADGKKIRGSEQKREIVFIKRADGGWWIKKL